MSDMQPVVPAWIVQAQALIEEIRATPDQSEKLRLHQKLLDVLDPERRKRL